MIVLVAKVALITERGLDFKMTRHDMILLAQKIIVRLVSDWCQIEFVYSQYRYYTKHASKEGKQSKAKHTNNKSRIFVLIYFLKHIQIYSNTHIEH